MMSEPEFMGFPKMVRLSRDCLITEKLDGTNAQIFIEDDGHTMHVGSRSRWLAPGKTDHFGFADWSDAHRDDLLRLGPGRHFGEWWGAGIQRRYGLAEKRFSLFNVRRWGDPEVRPRCCHVVPLLYHGEFTTQAVEDALASLRAHGSVAALGFMQAEGVVVYHLAANMGFKKTLDNDAVPKSLVHCNKIIESLNSVNSV